nr:unnamed protein product [Callosobruchus chinensis]
MTRQQDLPISVLWISFCGAVLKVLCTKLLFTH